MLVIVELPVGHPCSKLQPFKGTLMSRVSDFGTHDDVCFFKTSSRERLLLHVDRW